MHERNHRSCRHPERSEGPPQQSLNTHISSRDLSFDREVPYFARNDHRA
jgi:hypothetical protein